MGLLVVWCFVHVLLIAVFADEGFYMNEGANMGYPELSVINLLENVSLARCAYQCRLNKECKHTAFDDETGMCTLLRLTNFTNSGASDQYIYSPVKIRSGMCVCLNSKYS